MRYALYQHIQSMSHSFFDERRSGAIVARFVSDIQLAQNFVGSALTNVWMDSAVAGVHRVDPVLPGAAPRRVALAVMPLYVAVIRLLQPAHQGAASLVQEMIEDFSGELQEKIAAVGVVKAFGREEHEARRFHRTSHDLFDLTLHNVALSSASQAADRLVTTIAAAARRLGARPAMILRGTLSVGTMIAFYAYLGSLYLPLQRFSELSVVVSNSLAAIDRIFEFFDIRPDVVGSRPTLRRSAASRGRVELPRCRRFVYAVRRRATPALRDIDLDVRDRARRSPSSGAAAPGSRRWYR